MQKLGKIILKTTQGLDIFTPHISLFLTNLRDKNGQELFIVELKSIFLPFFVFREARKVHVRTFVTGIVTADSGAHLSCRPRHVGCDAHVFRGVALIVVYPAKNSGLSPLSSVIISGYIVEL